jgi:hypothetical protein
VRTDHDRRWAEIEARQAAAKQPFDTLVSGFLHLSGWGTGRTANRLKRALWALQEYRDAHQQSRNMGDGELILSVRVVADELAAQIQEAAPTTSVDPATIAWVLAGMRCPSQPFCTGCQSCFTITAPLRPVDGQVFVP